MGVSVPERLKENDVDFYHTMIDKIFSTMRVSVPGIIKKFDAEKQTAEVQVALREHVQQENMQYEWVEIDVLLDVPVMFPRGGGYVLTFPVKKGDECLVVFSDMCIDAWFSLGDIQNQIEKRRHDLSDGIALLGLWSQPKKLDEFSREHVELRNDDRSDFIRIKPGVIDLVAPTIRVNGVNITTRERYDEWIDEGGRVDR
ncbi:Gp138 family membrane-puncturing spike protein [uncultured Brevibacillus sp.]|uniref:Gp138 family membrane-puncturing spike protein n=1 Tax=uncultured Brevibacillus sp. TaxID=169970 RepID=UPI00259640A9|nr:Gp138 family membrane-puncturing spike protein [uncultured Brevibacillus sp.]